MDDTVIRRDRNGVAVLELNRPSVGNAIDLDLARTLGQLVAGVAGDPRVRCVLLRGAGDRFSVGGDISAMAVASDRGRLIAELAEAAHEAVIGLSSLEVPIVAEVQGAAAGAGLALALFADDVVVADSAVLLTAYGGVGLSPDCGTTWRLPRLVGARRAGELVLGGRRLTAAEALDWGIASDIAPLETLAEVAMQRAAAFAAAPYPGTGRSAKLLRGDLDSLARHLDAEAEAIAIAAASEEAGMLIERFARRA